MLLFNLIAALSATRAKKMIEKLITILKKYGKCDKGDESINPQGVKYRYDRYTYRITPYWLEKLFDSAKTEANDKNSNARTFSFQHYSFHCTKGDFKGEITRETSMSELIILG